MKLLHKMFFYIELKISSAALALSHLLQLSIFPLMWLSYFINTKPFNTMYIEFFQIIYASGLAVSITVVIIHSEYFVY